MRRVPCLLVLSIAGCGFALAQDWTQWRGPGRDGVVPSFQAPASWPETLRSDWKVTVGEGHSTPVVTAGKVYTFARLNERETASCLDLKTGRLIWSQSYPVEYTVSPPAGKHGKGPKSTPVIEGGRLYTLGITEVLSCYDAKTGKVIWRKQFGDRFKETSPAFGTSMSPVVDRGLLIVHVGGSEGGALIAFDAVTGVEKWSWKGDGPGFGSPVIAELGGVRQVVLQTQGFMAGVAVATGELLWKRAMGSGNAVTPVIHDQTVIYAGLDEGTTAIKIINDGGKWTVQQLWHNAEISMYMNSPVLSGDLAFGLSYKHKGEFFCLDARTGKTLWTSEGRQGENAAILRGGETLFLLTSDAELIVAATTENGFKPLKRYTVAASQTWAHPVIIGNRILIKDKTTLASFTLQ